MFEKALQRRARIVVLSGGDVSRADFAPDFIL